MKKLPSYIRDTTEFINLIEDTPLPGNRILASIDVSSLYTNIPHSEGKMAAMKALGEMDNPDPRQPAPEVIGHLIDSVLQGAFIGGSCYFDRFAHAATVLCMHAISDTLRHISMQYGKKLHSCLWE